MLRGTHGGENLPESRRKPIEERGGKCQPGTDRVTLFLDGVSSTLVGAPIGAVAALGIISRLLGAGQGSEAAFIPRILGQDAVYPLFFLCGLAAFLSGAFGEAWVVGRFEGIDPVKPPRRWKACTFAMWISSSLLPVMSFALCVVPRIGGLGSPGMLPFLVVLYLVTLSSAARGIRNLTTRVEARDSQKFLVTGTMILSGLGLVFRRNPTGHPGFRDVLVFLAVTQLSIVRKRRIEVAGVNDHSSQKPWAVTAIALLALSVLLAGVASFGGSILGELANILTWLAHPVMILLDYILIPVGYLAEMLTGFLKRFINPDALSLMEKLSEMSRQFEPEEAEETVKTLAPWVKWAFIAVVLCAFGAALWLVISRLTRMPETRPFKERRESLGGAESLKSWGQEVMRDTKALLAKTLSGLTEFGPIRKPKNVDELYAFTLRALERHGIHRNPSQTPFEYLAFARERITVPSCSDALASISRLFSRCHYSMKNPDTEEWRRATADYELITREDPDRPEPRRLKT